MGRAGASVCGQERCERLRARKERNQHRVGACIVAGEENTPPERKPRAVRIKISRRPTGAGSNELNVRAVMCGRSKKRCTGVSRDYTHCNG